MLPAELLAALDAEQAQYRSVSIQAVAALRFEGALIALQTVPAAEPALSRLALSIAAVVAGPVLMPMPSPIKTSTA